MESVPKMELAKFRHRRVKKDLAKNVTVQDPDVEYDPAGSPTRLRFLERAEAVVNGSRFVLRKASLVYYLYHYLAHERLTIVSNLCLNRQYDQD